jgi:hemerythrin
MTRTGTKPPPKAPSKPTPKPPSKAPSTPAASSAERPAAGLGDPPAAPVKGRFEWRPEYSVGIEEIDAQHQELFRRAGLFIESLRRQSRQEIGILLSFLRLYAVTHFGAEEAWMREAAYPAAAEHEKQHDRFIKDILVLSDQHEKKNGTGIEPARVSGWLEKWLKHHVTETDTDLARHLKACGVPPPSREPEPEDPPA